MTEIAWRNDSQPWQDILKLSGAVVQLNEPAEQRALMIQVSERVLRCQADVWIVLENPKELLDSNKIVCGDIDQAPAIAKKAATRKIRYYKVNAPETENSVKRRSRKKRITNRWNDPVSAIAVPVLYQDDLLAVLLVTHPSSGSFPESSLEYLDGLVSQAALALHIHRQKILGRSQLEQLYDDVRRRVDLLSLVSGMGNAITSVLDLEELLNEVVALIYEHFTFQNVYIYSIHPGMKKVILQAGKPLLEDTDDYVAFDLEDSPGLVPFVARQGETVHTGDVTSHPHYHTDGLPPEELRSEILIPLVFGGNVLGVLDVRSDQENAFSDDDCYVLEALADHVAIALRNANLYRSEQWRRKVADSMREVAVVLTEDADLDHVLDMILTELENTLPCAFVAIWLLEKASNDLEEKNHDEYFLQLAAVHLEEGIQHPTDTEETGLTPDEILQYYDLSSLPNPWLTEVLTAEYPSIRTPASPYEPLGAILDFPQDYSAIAAPLRVGGEAIGVLVMGHRTSGRYGSEAQAMTATFASYAAVAIENTRLYESAHDQAWVSTILLQVAEATQSITSLDELLETMVRITPSLIGVNACAILVYESFVDAFLPTSSFGLAPEQQELFKRWSVYRGEFAIFDQMLEIKKPVFFRQVHFDSLLEEDTNREFLATFDLEERPLVFFPMIAHGEVIGSFLVDYDLPSSKSYSMESIDMRGWDEKLTIIQGIAHQTGVAVENIQLVKAQKEEAYVSVALLQVAQAVVSLNELDEILEAVVRITPILVGVVRCVVFLWDGAKGVFRLSRYYGVSRSEVESFPVELPRENFLFLKAALETNSLVYHPIIGANQNLPAWLNLTMEDFDIAEKDLSQFGSSFQDDSGLVMLGYNKEFLKEDADLLIAFPLSVKGNVLGVMLTQESSTLSGKPSYHTRERRLEISIGISQQAALAIQNDLLQREAVERERLEREFQLAREIQQTFLPDELITLPGWDIHAIWRPARQVGGDFYDVFELPNGKMGMVIADVADKGVPAALFMTLIRTLIRAAVTQSESPAWVLRRVNDLLVPDSRRGMFVTVFYGVLTPGNGDLSYANAGHNPPLIIHNGNGTIEPLDTSGMALGILPGIECFDRLVNLEQGDLLVCYTDGITEAFSPNGEMFGVGRLCDLVRSVSLAPAKSVVDAIVDAVYDFTQGNPVSDDLTLLSLRRLSAG